MLAFIAMFTLAIIVVVAVAANIGTARFRHRYEAEKADLIRRARASHPILVDAGPRLGLPPPVRKYLEIMHSAGGAELTTSTLLQTGTLQTAPDRPCISFEAEQVYSMEPPGFVWQAKARVAPFISMLARDKFVAGKGKMLVRLLGLIPVADGRGPEMDQGAGLRYWGEVMAFPELALSRHLRWESIDDHRARFVAEHDGLRLAATVEFNAVGLPLAIHADRFRDVAGKHVLTPWTGYIHDWRRIDGRMFPARWESVWHLPEGDFVAVRMEMRRVATEPARAPSGPMKRSATATGRVTGRTRSDPSIITA